MKFVCNNCGFSAEIPEKRNNCPMCASSNVTVNDGSGKETGMDFEQKKVEVQEQTDNEENTSQETKDDVRKEKITLTDNFFNQKPNKEEQEIADVIKELYPDEEHKGRGFVLPDWKVLTGIGAAVVVLFVVVISAMSSGNSDDEDLTEIEDVEDVEEQEIESVAEKKEDSAEPEETERTVARVEEKKEPEEKKETVKEPEKEVAEKKEEAEVVENKSEKKVAAVVEKKPVETKKKTKQKPKKGKADKKAPIKKKKVNTGQKFNEFVQLGHKALGEKRYTDALHEYKNAMRLNPRNGKIYKFIGIAYAYMQNQNQACKNYKKYIQFTPNAKDKAQVQAFLEACP